MRSIGQRWLVASAAVLRHEKGARDILHVAAALAQERKGEGGHRPETRHRGQVANVPARFQQKFLYDYALLNLAFFPNPSEEA